MSDTCAKPENCVLAKAVGDMQAHSQLSHESTIRQEEVVKALATTVEKIELVNRDDHKDIFNKVNAVTLANAKKLTVKDVGQWVIVAIALITLVYTLASGKGGTVREVHYVKQSFSGEMGTSHSRAEGGVPFTLGGDVHHVPHGDNTITETATGDYRPQ